MIDNKNVGLPTPRTNAVDVSDAGEIVKPRFPKNQANQPGHKSHFKKPKQATKERNYFKKPKKKQIVLAKADSNVLRIIPLGGSGETGDKNMLVYEYNNDILIIDAGIKFADASMPGVDYVVCDTTYLENNISRVRGYLVTHGHEDHIGGFPYIWPKVPVPIYTAPLTAGLIKSKFEEHGITGAQFRIIKPNEKIQIGSFQVEPVRMTHSIPDILGLAITTKVGTVFHATDWKIDFTPAFGDATDFAKLAELSTRGVLAMLSDSTNVLESGYTMSEKIVEKTLEEIFVSAKGRIVVSSFASRIDRIQHVITACAKTGKKLGISGRSMERNINISMELGYLKVPQGVLIDIKTINSLPDHKVVVMCTGSQGEEYSALVRMANGDHRHIKIKKNDTVILSASQVPGNELSVESTINKLYREGAEVITNKQLDVHASGHANREEIKLLLSLVKPKYLIPIHGDYRRFVEHAKLAVGVGIPLENSLIIENGQIAEFDEQGNGRVISSRIPTGQILIDGSGIGDVGEIVLRDRQTMAKDGVFVVILTIDRNKGLVTSPDIISRGFVYMREAESLISSAREIAKSVSTSFINSEETPNWEILKKQLRDKITEYLFEQTARNPMVIPVIIHI